MTDFSRLSTYDYHLPPELIAKEPPAQRDGARLLVLHRQTQQLEHRQIGDLPDLLHAGDTLVLNNTRVVPAKLAGFRAATNGRWEGLFLKVEANGDWRLIGQTRGRLQPGEDLRIVAPHSGEQLFLELIAKEPTGDWLARPRCGGSPFELLEKFGDVPLPPYMEREQANAQDRDRYQTLFAKHPGSVAAPTAGLHFTQELLAECQERGIGRTEVTLHVGLGTFRPVATENVDEHVMHSEWGEVPAATAAQLLQTREAGHRVVAIGTTSVRTLQSAWNNVGPGQPWQGDTRLFLRPPAQIPAIDALLTNFHLPKSTLLMLVSAFSGYEFTMRAYKEAVTQQYRFFSYGDAMLIL